MKLQLTTLARLARKERPVKPAHCRTCLAVETFTTTGPGDVESSLDKKGICRDREACESRQPPLFTIEEAGARRGAES